MNKTAFFPGQGAQFTGMGQSVYQSSDAARRIFDCASDVAGFSVSDLCFTADKAELSRTINSQIAIFTCSLAVFEALKERGVTFDSCAGFSLGEYTALTASGILSLEDGLRLVNKRGELMQQAADRTDGCMAAVLNLDDEVVEAICAQTDGVVLPVNYNCDGQIVIAGTRDAVAFASEACKRSGARRVLPLAVSGAFHTPLMKEAAAQLRDFSQSLTVHEASMPLYSNVDAGILHTTDLPAHLERHMISPVRWKALVRSMIADGYNDALEIGPGKTLTGFARKISKELSCTAVESFESVISITE